MKMAKRKELFHMKVLKITRPKKERLPLFPKGICMASCPAAAAFLLQMLKMIEKKHCCNEISSCAVNFIEIVGRDFADRAQFIGDRIYVKVPVETLTMSHITHRNECRIIPAGRDIAAKSKQVKIDIGVEATHLSITG